MDTQEIDSTLDELENRLERLRALYEQYFLGIEKIEPAVARKDVDRRFWLLRRTQIRNTARRWRLQVLIQRYNTFQQYWTRICREIENGTYVRHLLKAKKNLGAEPKTWAAKKRMGLLRRGHGAETNGTAEPNGDGDLAGPSDGALAEGSDTRLEAPAALALEAKRPGAAPRRAVATLDLDDLGPLDLDFDEEPSPPPRPVAAATKVAPAPKSSPPAAPSPSAASAAPAAATTPAQVRPAQTGMPMPGGPARPPTAPAATRPTVADPRATIASAPTRPGAGDARAAVAEPPEPGAARPGVAGALRSVGAAPSAGAGPSPAQAPVAKPAQAPGGAPTAGSPAPNASGAGLSDERVRKLHAELIETKRQLKQGDNVSIDSLARSLRETEKKLRAQHEGRTVDFQIVVKDGKPVVKPVLRK